MASAMRASTFSPRGDDALAVAKMRPQSVVRTGESILWLVQSVNLKNFRSFWSNQLGPPGRIAKGLQRVPVRQSQANVTDEFLAPCGNSTP
jgi:hypothetical protein